MCSILTQENTLCSCFRGRFFYPIAEKKNKNDLDEGVRKCEHWFHIDLIKTYEQRWNSVQKIVWKCFQWFQPALEIAISVAWKLLRHHLRDSKFQGFLLLWWSIQIWIASENEVNSHQPCWICAKMKSLVHRWVSIAGSISALSDFFSWSVSRICLWSIGDLDWVSERSGAVRLQIWLPKHILSRQCCVGLQVLGSKESAERWA